MGILQLYWMNLPQHINTCCIRVNFIIYILTFINGFITQKKKLNSLLSLIYYSLIHWNLKGQLGLTTALNIQVDVLIVV